MNQPLNDSTNFNNKKKPFYSHIYIHVQSFQVILETEKDKQYWILAHHSHLKPQIN